MTSARSDGWDSGLDQARGFTLVELLLAATLMATLAAVATPSLIQALDDYRLAAAARHIGARCRLLRMEAAKRSRAVGWRFELVDGTWMYRSYLDGNGNGIRTVDIARGADPPLDAGERLGDKFPGVEFGILRQVTGVESDDDLEPGSDPLRIGRSDILTFTPEGTATAGTLYIRGR